MARARSSNVNGNDGAGGGAGGIADSGIFGLIGTTVQCEAGDTSWYCRTAKLINVIVWILMLVALFYVAKGFFSRK